jgi:hypothetical protein
MVAYYGRLFGGGFDIESLMARLWILDFGRVKLSRATHWPHTGLYIAISPPLGHHHSFTTYQYTPILSPQPLQALIKAYAKVWVF